MSAASNSALAIICSVAVAAGPVSALAATYKQLYAFQGGSGDGEFPQVSLLDLNGTLYGTTVNNGANGNGTVFAVNAASGAEKLVYSFQNDGDGNGPEAGLIKVGSKLYGTTYGGGNGDGTVYWVNPKLRAEEVVYAFKGSPDGANPSTSLIKVGSLFYGTTNFGGSAGGYGTVYSVNPATGQETVLYSFANGNEGGASVPEGSLLNVKGTLYGTTIYGGATDSGTVFSVNPSTGAEKIVYSFKGSSDGYAPVGGLVNVGGKLYGTTQAGGGGGGQGTVFWVDPKTGTKVLVYSFQGGADGAEPVAGLVDVGGTLYGTTESGGNAGYGTLFAIDPKAGTEKVLYSFKGGSDGASPRAGLINVKGTLYGTTVHGGDTNCDAGYGCGTVYSYNPK
jgi:uncharacterized repeat protein (TIGR03803 family)